MFHLLIHLCIIYLLYALRQIHRFKNIMQCNESANEIMNHTQRNCLLTEK